MRWFDTGLTIFGLAIAADVIVLDPLHLASYVVTGLLYSALVTVLSLWAIIDKKPLIWRTYLRMAIGALWMFAPMYIGFTRSSEMTIVAVFAGIYIVAVALWQAIFLQSQQDSQIANHAA
jgi:hypothetical protein